MHRIYLGSLPEHDPLHGYLQHDIQPQISASGSSTYRVFRLHGSNDVYLYEDRHSGTKVIGNFFLSSRKKDGVKAISRLTREFENLCLMRDYGLTGYPHHVVRACLCPGSADVPVRHIDGDPRPLLRMHYCFGHPFRKLYTAIGLNHSWAFIASYLANALLHSPGGLPTTDKHTSASHARRASPFKICACALEIIAICADTISASANHIILVLLMFSHPFVFRCCFSGLRAPAWS